jgi:hypothetical protein
MPERCERCGAFPGVALLYGHQAERILGSMAWRIVAVVGTLASLGFVAGIVRVFTNRPDPAMGVWDAIHRPHYLAPSPGPRILFALLAVGAICLAAAGTWGCLPESRWR